MAPQALKHSMPHNLYTPPKAGVAASCRPRAIAVTITFIVSARSVRLHAWRYNSDTALTHDDILLMLQAQRGETTR